MEVLLLINFLWLGVGLYTYLTLENYKKLKKTKKKLDLYCILFVYCSIECKIFEIIPGRNKGFSMKVTEQ